MAIQIKSDLVVAPVENPALHKLEEAYGLYQNYEVSVSGVDVVVPRFFETDGASIPPAAWQIIGTPFNPRFMRAAVAHDWLYHNHQVERDVADKVLKELLLHSGVNSMKVDIIYNAVRLAGEFYWGNDDEDIDYLNKLKSKLTKSGDDLKKFHFPDN